MEIKPVILNAADYNSYAEAFKPLSAVGQLVNVSGGRREIMEKIPQADAYYCSLAVRLDAEILACAKNLKVIATPSTGLDHINLDEAARRGIEVLSLKNDTEFLKSITATAEMAWGLLLSVARKVPAAFDSARRGEWSRDLFRGTQLAGKTLGILGYGRLGRILGEYGRAFSMRVIACDERETTPENGVEMVSFDRLLAEADVLSVHIHLTEANRNLLDGGAFAKMKRGAFLINTSRGAIIDEGALLEALESGRLAGAGLDVICGEWRSDLEQHPLIVYARTHDNLVITPHVGGVTWESQLCAYTYTSNKLKQYLENGFGQKNNTRANPRDRVPADTHR